MNNYVDKKLMSTKLNFVNDMITYTSDNIIKKFFFFLIISITFLFCISSDLYADDNTNQFSNFKCTPDDTKMLGRLNCWQKWDNYEGLFLVSEDSKALLSIIYWPEDNQLGYDFEFFRKIGLETIDKDENINECSKNIEIILNFKNKHGETQTKYDLGNYVREMGDYWDGLDGSLIVFEPPNNFLTDLSNSERLSLQVDNCGNGIANFNTTDFFHNIQLLNIPETLYPKIEIKKENKNENNKKQKNLYDITPLEEIKFDVEFSTVLKRCDSLYQALQVYWEERYFKTNDISDWNASELMAKRSSKLRRNNFKGGEDKNTYLKILQSMDEGDESAQKFMQSESYICKDFYNAALL